MSKEVAADLRSGAPTATIPWLVEPRVVDNSKICDNNKALTKFKSVGIPHPARGTPPPLVGVICRIHEFMDAIPTPPAIEEVQTRFSKRTAGVNMEHVGVTAEKMAKKRNLQGNETLFSNSFDVPSNMEIISTASQMGVNIPDDNFAVID
ncbi:hypothetical protein D1007_53345 [Hordeum vulgare]|nr:hypothetical protein D1007_53345 [Hordeum vulgare]